MVRHTIFEAKLDQNGPYLVSNSRLIELDQIMSDAKSKLEASLNSQVTETLKSYDQEVNDIIEKEKLSRNYETLSPSDKETLDQKFKSLRSSHRKFERDRLSSTKVQKLLKIRRGNKYFLTFNSLDEASRSQELDGQPDSFEYIVSHNTYDGPKISFELQNENFRSLRIEGKPDTNPVVEDVFVSLKQWSEKNAPPTLLRYWSEFGGISACLLFWLILSIGTKLTVQTKQVPTKLNSSIQAMIAEGVNLQNSPKATELLLRASAGEKLFDEVLVQRENVAMYWQLAFLIPLVCFIRPRKGIICLKNGSCEISYWQKWIKLITYGIPFFITTTLVAKFIESLV